MRKYSFELNGRNSHGMLEGMKENKQLEELRKTLMATIGKRIVDTRILLDKQQSELLEGLKKYGLLRTQGTLSNIERGTRLPSLEMLYVIARDLDTSTDFLLGLTENQLSAADIEEEIAEAKGEGRINKIMKQMPDAQRQQILTFAEYLLASQPKQRKPGELPALLGALPPTERQLYADLLADLLGSVEGKEWTDMRDAINKVFRDKGIFIDPDV